MATSVSATSSSLRHRFGQSSFLSRKLNNSIATSIPSFLEKGSVWEKNQSFKIWLVKKTEDVVVAVKEEEEGEAFDHDLIKQNQPLISRVEKKLARKKLEKFTYLVAAIMSSLGITSMAAAAVYYRFSLQMKGGEIPALQMEMFGTFALSVGAAIGMEYWARWAHNDLWHGPLLWHMHESHHRVREGAFEMNDVFAIINAVPAISLLAYGFFHQGLVPALCFGAGLGITIFGMAYMFVHDGLVHRRFPVGPIADVPYLRRVAAAHHVHHSNKFDSVPFGLFLGPQELESKVGGKEEIEKELKKRMKLSKGQY